MAELVLASASPRRAQLLTEAGFEFTVHHPDVSEKIEKNRSPELHPDQLVLLLAERKARASASTLVKASFQTFVLAADTEVFLDGERLGKPENSQAAKNLLLRLSGRIHEVKTGLMVLHPVSGLHQSSVTTTKVQFRNLSEDEVLDYVQTGDPLDKAGAYGIQGAAKSFVQEVLGPLDNVIGLPMDSFEQAWTRLRFQIFRTQVPASATLVAISKTQIAQKIRWAHTEGQLHFGENYVQEAVRKKAELQDLPLIWHFVGALQKNKVKMVVGEFDFIHSVDSAALLKKIEQIAGEKKLRQKVFLQINVSDEASKIGLSENEAEQLIRQAAQFPHVEIVGLMAFPPLQDAENNRKHFQKLQSLRDQWRTVLPSLSELSMGTTNDFTVALECGATFIRIGSALFGERKSKGAQ